MGFLIPETSYFLKCWYDMQKLKIIIIKKTCLVFLVGL